MAGDIRWMQRLDSFNKAFTQLENAVKLAQSRELSDLEKQGLIQSFEFTHELAWKTMKDFFKLQGNNDIYGSKDAVKEGFSYGLNPETVRSLQAVFKSQPQIKSVIIYGSRAKGNYKTGSDIDFAVK